jgi:hypothetical protein
VQGDESEVIGVPLLGVVEIGDGDADVIDGDDEVGDHRGRRSGGGVSC